MYFVRDTLLEYITDKININDIVTKERGNNFQVEFIQKEKRYVAHRYVVEIARFVTTFGQTTDGTVIETLRVVRQ